MFKFLPFNAPSAYVFPDPDSGHEHKGVNKADVIQRIIKYRAQNGLEPIEELGTVLDNYWCLLPENMGKCEEFKLQRGWFEVWKGGLQILKNIAFGSDAMVPQEEADRRAKICSDQDGIPCQFNVFPDRDMFIKWSDAHAEASTGGRKSKPYATLGNCALCTCSLRAKVWAKNALMTEKQSSRAPAVCWAKRI